MTIIKALTMASLFTMVACEKPVERRTRELYEAAVQEEARFNAFIQYTQQHGIISDVKKSGEEGYYAFNDWVLAVEDLEGKAEALHRRLDNRRRAIDNVSDADLRLAKREVDQALSNRPTTIDFDTIPEWRLSGTSRDGFPNAEVLTQRLRTALENLRYQYISIFVERGIDGATEPDYQFETINLEADDSLVSTYELCVDIVMDRVAHASFNNARAMDAINPDIRIDLEDNCDGFARRYCQHQVDLFCVAQKVEDHFVAIDNTCSASNYQDFEIDVYDEEGNYIRTDYYDAHVVEFGRASVLFRTDIPSCVSSEGIGQDHIDEYQRQAAANK